MKDVLGRDIRVGDVVVFATKFGQTAWLKLSIICKITDKDDWRGKHQTISIMSADLYGTNGGQAKLSLYGKAKDRGYPQLGHGADPQKMLKLCSYDAAAEYYHVAEPLINAYKAYLEEQK